MKIKVKQGVDPFDVSTGEMSIRVDENTSQEDLTKVLEMLGEDSRLEVTRTSKEIAQLNTTNTNE